MSPKTISYSQNRICLKLPNISADEWCDLRCAYEQGKTLKQIAFEYHCDPRTVRKCLFLNQGSNDIGKQNCAKKITAFIPIIDRLYQKYTCIDNPEICFPDTDHEASSINNLVPSRGSHNKENGLCKISKLITDQIKAEGYTGSERTVRNYLRSRYISIQPDTCRKMKAMITVKTTPNKFGISLQGDYQDLNALYDSISRYLEFYMANNEFYPYHEYEYLLSLNYDIRHAYMGTRNVEIKENNASEVGVFAESIFNISNQSLKDFSDIRKKFKHGNLYFGVDILYPLVFHYLVSMSEITYEDPYTDWFSNLPDHMDDYNMIHANRDRAMILHFISLLWENVEDLLGSEMALEVMEYYENSEEFVLAPSLYTDALIHWQLANYGALSEDNKRHFLLKSLYEIIDAEALVQHPDEYRQAYNQYKEASKSIKKIKGPDFPEKNTFYQLLDELTSTGEPLYHSTFDAFLNTQYGVIKDENPEM